MTGWYVWFLLITAVVIFILTSYRDGGVEMSSVLIAMVCDADLCNQYPKVQELREYLTIGDCERLSNYFEGGN